MTSTGLKALLLDLDDTLFGNSMDTFIPAYFQALTEFVADLVPPDLLIEQLLRATRTMGANDGSGPSNAEVFAAAFYPALPVPREEIEPVLERFYLIAFPRLRSLTQRRPAAPKIIEWARSCGLQVAVATNPLFPQTAIEQRLDWAGVPVERWAYELVTCYENCHATKSHSAYYQRILDQLGRRPAECLMVGDNWSWDVVQPAELGIPAYWIADPDAAPPEPAVSVVGQGSLQDFYEFATSGELEVTVRKEFAE